MADVLRPDWHADGRMTIGEVGYHLLGGAGEPAPDDFHMLKSKLALDCYEPIVSEFRHGNIVELGVYAGGSTAYLAQRCAPRHLVAIDFNTDRLELLDRFV